MAKRRNVSGRVLRNAVPQPRDVAEFVAPRTVNEGLSVKNVFGDVGDMIDPFITAAIEKQEGLRDVSDDELKMLAALGSIPVAGAVASKITKKINKLVPNPKGGFLNLKPGQNKLKDVIEASNEAGIMVTPEIEKAVHKYNIKIVAVKRRFQILSLSELTLKPTDDIYFFVETAHLNSVLEIFGYETLPPRYIVVYGGGRVGFQFAKQLEINGSSRDITLVELGEERSRFLAEKLETTLVINGDALDDSLIDELNLKNYKIAIATTNSDENNILLSMVSKRAGIDRVCALIHNPLYNNLLSGLGIDTTINPNAVMVSSILQYLRKGRVKDDYFIQSGIGEVLEIEAMATAKITKVNLGKVKVPQGVIIAGILRGDLFMLPHKDLMVHEKDRVFLFVERGHVHDAEKLFSVGISFF